MQVSRNFIGFLAALREFGLFLNISSAFYSVDVKKSFEGARSGRVVMRLSRRAPNSFRTTRRKVFVGAKKHDTRAARRATNQPGRKVAGAVDQLSCSRSDTRRFASARAIRAAAAGDGYRA